MRRLIAAAVCLAGASLSAFAQSGTEWGMSIDTDKMTDRKTLIATASTQVSDVRSPAYQLELRCDGKVQQVSIATFDATGAGRDISWQTETFSPERARSLGVLTLSAVTVSSVGFRYRVDDAPAQRAVLAQQRYANAGTSRILPDALPSKRLLVADIFPDETVEFSFTALTQGERDAIQKMCFPASPR